jgi:hypothetical protein
MYVAESGGRFVSGDNKMKGALKSYLRLVDPAGRRFRLAELHFASRARRTVQPPR